MDELRKQTYRFVLAQGLLHLKWDLCRFYAGLSFTRPWRLFQESRAIRKAALRAYAFHNLAIHATSDFEGFSEAQFWQDIEKFRQDCPESLCQYREVFERCLRGESVNIFAPSGAIQVVE